MNPRLAQLQPYPFERLKQLLAGISPGADYPHISLGMGEPKHATPALIEAALCANLHGLASYPATAGEPALRQAFAAWAKRRYGVTLDALTQTLPVNGSREALFALAQTVIDTSPPSEAAQAKAAALQAREHWSAAPKDGDASTQPVQRPLVVCPNPFYQIYEGAALLAGADTYFAPSDPARNFRVNWAEVPDAIWRRTQLLFVCSPGNPTGAVMPLSEWELLFDLSDRFGFVIASDECYSEIYFGEHAPLGGLEAAAQLGRSTFKNLIALTSLSKRSNVPGMRSGFAAGDAEIIRQFLLYRTYHGSGMSPVVQAASIAAWNDEAHVQANRALYAQKFAQVTPLLAQVMDVKTPDAGFYLWAGVPANVCGGSDTEFARQLLAQYNVTVLPGSYLARGEVPAHLAPAAAPPERTTVSASADEADDDTQPDEHANANHTGYAASGAATVATPTGSTGLNPGTGRVRLALVAPVADCLEAARRIVEFIRKNAQ